MSVSVLVVDDSKLPRKLVIRSLPEEIEFSVREASDGADAMEAIRLETPDVMFLDLTMPGMDGFEVLAQLREEAFDFPVIVISADVQEKAVAKVKELGAREFLKKPASAEELRRALEIAGIV